MTSSTAVADSVLSCSWLKRRHVLAVCLTLLAISAAVFILLLSPVKDAALPPEAAIGGDYVAFDVAAKAAAEGKAASTYDQEVFENLLTENGPPRERYGLTWQYPPTYFFIILPLAALGFMPGYILWTGGTMAAFFAALHRVGFRGIFLIVILAAPSTFHAFITGQNGFLTATLLAVAALYPDKRPMLAGLAAALLTVKPQLGLLIPVAYLAGGCWRAFLTASLCAVALAGASFALFGLETWQAFLGGLAGASSNVAAGILPLFKMTTPFAAARLAGASVELAGVFQVLCALSATAAIAFVWRRVRDAELRAAALCAGVFFAAPYGYYYELVVLALPLAILAKRGLESGWVRFEQLLISLAFITPLTLPGDARRLGVSIGFVVVSIVATAVFRRIAHEAPEVFKFASSGARPQSG